MRDNPLFDAKVGGRVTAEIMEGGRPVSAAGRYNHYKVRLSVRTQNPDVDRVTYKLDPTYYDPVRESSDPDSEFSVDLTTYGDYPVTVEAQVGGEIVRRTVRLSELLEEAHGTSPEPPVQDAIAYIKTH